MEAELRNFQTTVFSLCGSGIAPSQSFKSHTILYVEAELRNFKSQNIPCAEEELQAKKYSMCGSHMIVCVRKRNFKSHNSLYVESLWFLMQESEEPGSARSMAPLSKPPLRCCLNCAILAMAPTWIVLRKRVLGKGSVQYYQEPLQEHIDLVTRIANVKCFSHTWSLQFLSI